MPGRPKAALLLSSDVRSQLQAMAGSDSLRPALAMRAGIVLACAAGETNAEIAKRLSLSEATVGKWRRRFLESGCPGLDDRARPGKPPVYDRATIAALLDKVRNAQDAIGSIRGLAKELGLPKSSVHRYLRQIEFQQCLGDGNGTLGDPRFLRKARQMVGLYLNPPDGVLLLGVERQGKSVAAGRDGKDMAILAAKLNVAFRTPKRKSAVRQRHYELLDFFKQTEGAVPDDVDIHAIANNKFMCAHPRIDTWLAARHRWSVHAVQAPEAWPRFLQQVFRAGEKGVSRRKRLVSAKEIVDRVRLFEAASGRNGDPFLWMKSFGNVF